MEPAPKGFGQIFRVSGIAEPAMPSRFSARHFVNLDEIKDRSSLPGFETSWRAILPATDAAEPLLVKPLDGSVRLGRTVPQQG